MATVPRLFVDSPLAAGAAVALDARYLGAVLRRRIGDPVLLFNGKDGEWAAHITALDKRQVHATLERQTRPQAPEPGPVLAMAPLRRDATELVVRQATELGASAIHFVITARTQPARLHLERLEAIAIEAAEQSERLTIPRLESAVPLAAFLESWPRDRLLVAAIERTDADAAGWPAAGGLLVGPEGGFAPADLAPLRALDFVRCGSLGPRILRAETAAAAGLARLPRPM